MSVLKNIKITAKDILNLDESIIKILLIDRTTNKNITWATSDYEQLGEFYKQDYPMTSELILNKGDSIIKPRILKTYENQLNRTKGKAEVSTPSWVCNAQNNIIDLQWVEDKKGFNKEKKEGWITNKPKIQFRNKDKQAWQKYVKAIRMEITCGEAPYIVSRYDTTTGEYFDFEDRIGILDRKIRIINENTEDEKEWYFWVIIAIKSVYGFELQGDSLLLARGNILSTFIDSVKYKLNRKPTNQELQEVATIVSWNIWQMDGLKFTVPHSRLDLEHNRQMTLFDVQEELPQYCVIKDWNASKRGANIEFTSLIDYKGE